MVRLAKKIREHDKYATLTYIFELRDGIEKSYVMGGFYPSSSPLTTYAFFTCAEDGKVLSEIPKIQGEGVNSYREIFELEGYTLLDAD